MTMKRILVAGAGVVGLWQALALSRAGHAVTLCDRSPNPNATSASHYAGAMLAPWCEAEAAPGVVRDLGVRGLAQWRDLFPGVVTKGSLVIAAARDRSELVRFGKRTTNFEWIDADRLAQLEPVLGGRFSDALYFAEEAHMSGMDALAFLFEAVHASGCAIALGQDLNEFDQSSFDVVVDARGLAAQGDIPDLRGVRGERVLVRCRDIDLKRPVRLLHPRHPLYIVPWPDHTYMIGATVIENEEEGAASVRSVLELLGAAYAVHPAFADAEIIDIGAGVRPSFPDNVPRILVSERSKVIRANGAYRHGFLLAPTMAEAVVGWLATAETSHPLVHCQAATAAVETLPQ
ncbi:MAG: FAD-dependent oxidoreductase [Pseudomonadota bacterium]